MAKEAGYLAILMIMTTFDDTKMPRNPFADGSARKIIWQRKATEKETGLTTKVQ